MNKLPKVDLYISTKKAKEKRLFVERSDGDDADDADEFYFVDVIDEASKNDMSAMGYEMDNKQWESLVKEYGLEYQGDLE